MTLETAQVIINAAGIYKVSIGVLYFQLSKAMELEPITQVQAKNLYKVNPQPLSDIYYGLGGK